MRIRLWLKVALSVALVLVVGVLVLLVAVVRLAGRGAIMVFQVVFHGIPWTIRTRPRKADRISHVSALRGE